MMKLAKPAGSVQPSFAQRPQSRPWWGILAVASMAFHGALLLLPMPQSWLQSVESEPELENVLEQSGAIALTTLPVIPQPAPQAAPPEDLVPISPEPPPLAPELPPITQVPDNIPEELLEPLAQQPEAPLEQEPPLDDPDIPQAELETKNLEPEAGIATPFSENFPHIAGAQSGCYGLENCRIVTGKTFTVVAQSIIEALETQGYELTLSDANEDSEDRNHRVYEMRQLSNLDAEVKYLNIFGEGLKGAVYIITPEHIGRGDLEALISG